MNHLIIEFNHSIEDVIPYCIFIDNFKSVLKGSNLGRYLGDDMAIDGGDAEAIFECNDAKIFFNFIYPHLKSLSFMHNAKIRLILGPINSDSEEVVISLT